MLGRHVFGGVRTAAVTDATRVVRQDGVVAGERTGEAAAQPSTGGDRRRGRGRAAAVDRGSGGAARVPDRACRRFGGFLAAGGRGGRVPVRGVKPVSLSASQGCYVPTARTPRCRRPGGSGDSLPRPGGSRTSRCSWRCARTGPLSRVLQRLTDPLPAE